MGSVHFSFYFFEKKNTTFIQQGYVKLIKRDSKDFLLLEYISILNKYCYFLTFYSSKNPEKKHHRFQKNIKQQKWIPSLINRHIRMISERSCDTEFFWSRKYFYQINAGLMSIKEFFKTKRFKKKSYCSQNFWTAVITDINAEKADIWSDRPVPLAH